MHDTDELVGRLMRRVAELERRQQWWARVSELERRQLRDEQWRELVDRRLERLTDALEREREGAERTSAVELVAALHGMNAQARSSRSPGAIHSWQRVALLLAGAIAALAGAIAAIAELVK